MIEAEWQAIVRPKVEWKDQPKKTYIVMKDTHLVNVLTGENIRAYTAGNLLDFVQYCTYNGKVYYRTDYSRDNKVDNGIPANDVVEYVPEPEEKLKWEALPKPVTMVTLRDAKLLNIPTGEIIKSYEPGYVIEDFVDQAVFDGSTYLRTGYYRNKKMDKGIDLYQLTEYVAPSDAPEEPAPELPEGDVERPEGAKPIDGDAYPSWFVNFINSVIEFVKSLINKKGE